MIVYSANGEEFQDDHSMIVDEILSNCETLNDAKDAIIYIGESVEPNVKAEWVHENLIEYVLDTLYDQCGEYSDNYEPSHNDELLSAISLWLDKQNYRCYTVKNIREESIMNHILEADLDDFPRV